MDEAPSRDLMIKACRIRIAAETLHDVYRSMLEQGTFAKELSCALYETVAQARAVARALETGEALEQG